MFTYLKALRIAAIAHRGEPYFDYIAKIKANPLARAVKLSDLKQNSDLNRLKVVTEKDEQRRIKYQKAIGILEN